MARAPTRIDSNRGDFSSGSFHLYPLVAVRVPALEPIPVSNPAVNARCPVETGSQPASSRARAARSAGSTSGAGRSARRRTASTRRSAHTGTPGCPGPRSERPLHAASPRGGCLAARDVALVHPAGRRQEHADGRLCLGRDEAAECGPPRSSPGRSGARSRGCRRRRGPDGANASSSTGFPSDQSTSPSRRSRPSTTRYRVERLTDSSAASASMSIVARRRKWRRPPATTSS